jgi:hypothetical protein
MRLGDRNEVPGRIEALEKSGTRRRPRRYFPMIQEDPIPGGGCDQFASLVPPLDLSNHRLTHAVQQRSDFERALSARQTRTVNERLSETIEQVAFTIALGRTKAIAAALDLDAEHGEMGLREFLFTASIPDVPELSDPQ